MDSFFLTLILSLTITDVLFSKVKMEDKKKTESYVKYRSFLLRIMM